DLDLLEDLADQSYSKLSATTATTIPFPLRQMQDLKPSILRRVVTHAVQQFHAPQPSAERLSAVQNLVFPPMGRASSAGPVQLEGHVSVYREKVSQEYAKLLVIRSTTSE